jgi:hypothetical protein
MPAQKKKINKLPDIVIEVEGGCAEVTRMGANLCVKIIDNDANEIFVYRSDKNSEICVTKKPQA